MLQYPEVVDLEAVTTMFNIVKNREIAAKPKELCLAGWNVAGYLLRISVGVPEDKKVGAFYAHSGQLQDGLEELEAALSDYENGPKEFSASNPKEAESIGTIITIISVVLNLLRALGFTKQVRETHEFTNAGMQPIGEGGLVAEAADYYDPEDIGDIDEEDEDA